MLGGLNAWAPICRTDGSLSIDCVNKGLLSKDYFYGNKTSLFSSFYEIIELAETKVGIVKGGVGTMHS